MAYGDYDMVGVDLTPVRRVKTPEFVYRDMVVKITNPVGPGALFKREAYEATGPWNEKLRLSPDYDFWLRLGLRGEFSRVPVTLSMLRLHNESQSFAKADEAKSEEFIWVISNYYASYNPPSEVLTARNEALSNAYLFSARSHVRSGRYVKGLVRLLQGFYLHPRNLSGRAFKILAHGFLNHVRYRKYVKPKMSGTKARGTRY